MSDSPHVSPVARTILAEWGIETTTPDADLITIPAEAHPADVMVGINMALAGHDDPDHPPFESLAVFVEYQRRAARMYDHRDLKERMEVGGAEHWIVEWLRYHDVTVPDIDGDDQ